MNRMNLKSILRLKFSKRWGDLLRSYMRNPLAKLGTVVLFIVIILAIFAPEIVPYDPLKQNLNFVLLPPCSTAQNDFFLLGTDEFGRDILSRVLYGARVSLPIASLAALLAMVIGILVGMVSGYMGGTVDTICTSIIDIFLVFPLILIALSLAAILGPSQKNLVLVMVITGWMTYARVIRSEVLALKNKEFIDAAKVLGGGDFWVIFRHVFPNIVSPALVIFTFNFSQFVILESALSFLGLGVPPPTPTWGNMLYEGRDVLTIAPWVISFPGIFLMVTVLCVNFIGDGLRDALDPIVKGMI